MKTHMEARNEVVRAATESFDRASYRSKSRAWLRECGGPTDAAWAILEEQLEPFTDKLEALVVSGQEDAARNLCEGLLLALHRLVEGTDDHELVRDAPDFPSEAAGMVLERWLRAPGPKRELSKELLDGELRVWAGFLQRTMAEVKT
jgi:hypothetical protein